MDINLAKKKKNWFPFPKALWISWISGAETSEMRVCWHHVWNKYRATKHKDSKSLGWKTRRDFGYCPSILSAGRKRWAPSLGGRRAGLVEGTLVHLSLKTGTGMEHGPVFIPPQLSQESKRDTMKIKSTVSFRGGKPCSKLTEQLTCRARGTHTTWQLSKHVIFPIKHFMPLLAT